QVLRALPHKPQILWLTPQSLNEIFDNLRDLGSATGAETEAQRLIEDARLRIDRLSRVTSQLSQRPRVFWMEWLEPVYASGHWVPELVWIAGGDDQLGSRGGESVRVSWAEISDWAPEVLVIMPCGFNLQQTMKQIWDVFGSPAATSSGFFDL